MATRGVQQAGAVAITTRFLGVFDTDHDMRERFLTIAQALRNRDP
jgi:GTP cyclohydrolase I